MTEEREPGFQEPIEYEEECENCEVRVAAICQSCGMPMNSAADYGGGNEDNNCCVHCCCEDGSLKSYEEVHQSMISLFMKTRGLDKERAEQAARDYMATMPAWIGR
ncbi:MAG TPA: AraC family transcriptional regulator [Dehalococcoidia bacterium]|nr:AraC family transcriptional regulator [Dehalococcoidia bacterium]